MEFKIPFYNILNMFLTGLTFLGGLVLLHPDVFINIISNRIWMEFSTGFEIIFVICVFSAVYEVGLIFNRLGSVLIEYLLIKIKIIKFDENYKEYNDVKKNYPIMDTLSREYSLSRTSLTLFLILAILAFIECKNKLCGLFLIIMIIFLLSCKKHSKRILKLIGSEESGEDK